MKDARLLAVCTSRTPFLGARRLLFIGTRQRRYRVGGEPPKSQHPPCVQKPPTEQALSLTHGEQFESSAHSRSPPAGNPRGVQYA